MLRQCLGDPGTGARCDRLTPAARCPMHARSREAARHNRLYDSSRWHRLRTSLLAAHRKQFGDWCPLDGGHPAERLSLDHIQPLARGGDLFDRTNLRVVCLAHNSEKGARLTA